MSIYKPLRDSREHPKIRLLRLFRLLSDQPDRAQIRLLRLHPGDFNDPIDCDIKVTTYAKSIKKYEAISYCWGNAEDTVPLTCNGVRTLVTRNLHDALRRFRPARGTAARLLWADALCINQKDYEEKGKQVGRMGEVFANASRVLVWLGGDVDDTTATDTFAMIREINQYLGEVFIQCRQNLNAMPVLSKPYPICLEENKWHGVAALLKSSWFSRVWTIQEAALAKECTVFWGHAEIEAADIIELCLWCGRKQDLGHILGEFAKAPSFPQVYLNFLTYELYRSGYSGSGKWFESRPLSADFAKYELVDHPWLSLLDRCSSLNATDARDYIYAFLGCPAAISDNNHPYLEADYTISKDGLYKRVARILLHSPKEGPWVLHAVRQQDREELMRSRTTSWVPSWGNARRVPFLTLGADFSHMAGGSKSLLQTEEHDGATLSIRGQLLDEVTWMSDIIESERFLIARQQPELEPYIDKLWNQLSRQMAGIDKVLHHKDFFLALLRGFYGSSSHAEKRYGEFSHAYLEAVGSKVITDASKGKGEIV
ncbi:hypothetical protein HBI52_103290 [Parastagonospora nodorum]|nr:hypothetical protein HBH82_147280 [Parastagonospora nodorum]KAH4683661.1 hypothetical protein HBH78_119070 [Parastagonospora nodorum]KAH4704890.1 hypothetical protein HBH67_099950 [Parastagonospora nodorum]KAH4790783.1 hypothetical protein HBH62_039050 [Parastagonospora nodorum]KAH4794962.1 hypothetical protein HBH63_093120 [Parastagonospora nodorum]